MGVPAFYRWLSSRYPKCVVLLEEQEPVVMDGVEIPIDCTQESPNGHVDNLYLDMNGIIHPCFHPEDKPAPLTFEQCFKDIFAYIDRIMAIVRPRKVLFMAIDGVAPRAKMNQQRSRRFKTAKDAQDKLKEEKRIRAELQAQGMKVRDAKHISDTSALGDSNIITPGTAFMAKLSIALQYYIHQRINTQPAWKPLVVMLSDANAPGEGEHKIMEYIREQRGRPGWHPNMTHVVSGLDADLIHLALATHEPHFHILREVVFGPSAGDAPEGGAKPKVPYQYLKISLLRDYLELEFSDVRLPFPFDKERIFDDFVFLCFFVGNDFLPHSPTLEIREGGIDLLMTIYKRQLPFMGGWLCNGAKVNLRRVEVIVREVARCEEQILQKRMRIMKNQESKRNSAVKRPMSVETMTPPPIPIINPATEPCKGTPKKQRTEEEEDNTDEHFSEIDPSNEQATPVNPRKVWEDLMSVSPAEKAVNILPAVLKSDSDEETDDGIEEMVQTRLKNSTHEKADMFDSMVQHGEAVGFGMQGWKERYYRMKIPNIPEKERVGVVKDMVEKFVEGLMWVMAYYYEGVASWTWYYPYHYAPFASDMIKIAHIQTNFQLGDPFLPVNQLMAVLPAASRFCLPQCLQHLFVNKDSPIIDFYPEDFKCDMNGKRFAWQAVVLLPFIDEERLIHTTKEYFGEFTDEEKERNKRKLTQFYVGDQHPLAEFLKNEVSFDNSSKVVKLELDPEKSYGLNGHLYVTEDHCPEMLPAPFELGEDITQNRVVMGSFLNPPHQRHLCQLMPGTEEESTGLTIYDIPPEQELWHEHPRAGHHLPSRSVPPRPQFAIDRDAAHRFVVHSVSGPRFRDEAPQRATPQKFTLRASAPEFVPEHVTRMALQMTEHRGSKNPSIRPPLVPPDAVTDAAIRLSERTRRPSMIGGMQPMFPMTPPPPPQQQQQLNFHHPNYSSLMMPQFPAGFPSFMPPSPMQGGQHIRGPAFFESRPHGFGNVRTPPQHPQRPPGFGGNARTPSQRSGDVKKHPSYNNNNKRKK